MLQLVQVGGFVAVLQLSPAQQVSGATHDWPALLHEPPLHVMVVMSQARPGQQFDGDPHGWPELLHIAAWQMPLAQLAEQQSPLVRTRCRRLRMVTFRPS